MLRELVAVVAEAARRPSSSTPRCGFTSSRRRRSSYGAGSPRTRPGGGRSGTLAPWTSTAPTFARRAASAGWTSSFRTCPLRRADAGEEPRLRAAGRAHPGPRHRRQHRHLQRDQRRAAQAAALRARRSPRRRAAVGAALRAEHARRGHRRVLRLPRAGRCVRRAGRVPPDELRPAEPRRAGSREHGRRVGQLLRPARDQPVLGARSWRQTMCRARRRCWCSATPTGARSSAATRTSSGRCSR
jgi:hypothetical protein